MVMEAARSGDGHGSRPLCGARLRQAEGTCRRPAGAGTEHLGSGRCSKHGGSTPTQTVAALRDTALRDARSAVRDLGFEPVGDPLTHLQSVAGEAIAVKDMLRGEVERVEQLRYEGRSGEQLRGELVAYQASLRDAVSVLATIARLNIDERLVQISEKQAGVVLAAIDAMLAHLGITGQVALDAKRVAARHLRALPPADRDGA